ncbi:hypothetical protein L9F63_020616 [Diploptera punctata]|uniref:Serpin domain-containing protein n=1 Tax=Diploptera punctata TaxID=6984 RepID=A0AAD8ECS7_DIPPU|nr:hypothetical protein L9F63_020616 [Diploptera punctata]
MKRVIISICIVCLVLQSPVDGSISQELTSSTNQFSVDLIKTILHEKTGNIVSCPLGVYFLLATLQQGTGGNSRGEINDALHSQPDETREACRNISTKYATYRERQVTLDFKTRAFINTTFEVKPEFKQTLVEDFKSDIDLVDFTSPDNSSNIINTWVQQSTNNRISSLFEPSDLPQDTVLAVVNAVYFKNFWLNRFYETENKNFSSTPDVTKEVPTMSKVSVYNGGENADLGAKFVHLEFAHTSDFSVLLVLPTERHGLNNVLERLTADNLISLLNYTDFKRVTLSVPKFQLNSDINLITTLPKLGVNEVFHGLANLTGIGDLPLFVGKFVQKAEILVDEGGVTASAATGYTVQQRSGRRYPHVEETMEFIADHPFLFFIVDRVHNLPLFAGRVSSP